MPLKALKRGIRYAALGILMSASVLSTIAMGQITETAATLESVADKWGIFASLTVGLIGFTVFMFYRESTTNRMVLNGLVERSIKSADGMADAMTALRDEQRSRPCTAGMDSDKFEESVKKVRQRREQKEPQ